MVFAVRPGIRDDARADLQVAPFLCQHNRADDDIEIDVAAPVMYPSDPVYGPRRTGSRLSMISMQRILGTPVIVPPGNIACIKSNASSPGPNSPAIFETRWLTCEYRSSPMNSSVRTVP